MIKPYTSEFFEKYLKFENDANKEMKSLIKNDMKLKDYIQVFKKLKLIRKKKSIPYSVIKTFYEQPEKFFGDYHKILENSTFFDSVGNSIFYHFFYVLYVDYKRRNNIGMLNENEKNLNFQIYESKFELFLKEYEKYFLLQDVVLDTPLHKIAKIKEKGFFIELYQKLKKINLISNELLLTNNLCNETICIYILNEIKYNTSKIKNEEFYYNFINENQSKYESFSKEDQKILKNFSSKIIFEIKQYKEENFSEIFNNLNYFVNNNLKSPNLFENIYYSNTSNINYLNCLFSICSKDEDYDKLFNLVFLLSDKIEIVNNICLTELCLIDHIEYVIRKMGLYNRKLEQEYKYGIKLMEEILYKIMINKLTKIIKKMLRPKRFKIGLSNNIVYNQNISFDKKIKLFDLLDRATEGVSKKCIVEKNTDSLYKFCNLFEEDMTEMKEITKYYIIELKEQYNFIEQVLTMDHSLVDLIIIDINSRNKDGIQEFNEYIIRKIEIMIEFLNKNSYNSFKYLYNLSDEKLKKILYIMLVYNKDNYFPLSSLNFNNELVKNYILSNKTILEYYLIEMMKINHCSFFEYLFLSEFDLSHIFDFYNQKIKEVATCLEYLGYSEKPVINYHLIKGKPYEEKYLAFLFIISGFVDRIDLLLPFKEGNFFWKISKLNKYIRRNLFKNWNHPFDYIHLTKIINKYILPLSKLFIKKKEMFKGIINEIAPNLNIEIYLKVMDIVINLCEKSFIPESILNNDVEEDIFNDFCLNLIFIYIKKKFESQIPNISVFLLIHLLKADHIKFINLFDDSIKKGNMNNILNYLYFTEPCYSDEKYNLVDYLKKNNDSFCKILKKLDCIIDNKNYIKIIKPYLKGYAFYDNNNSNKNIPYHKYTDFDEYLEAFKYCKDSKELNIRALALFDIKKRSNDNGEDNDNYNYICKKLFEEKCSLFEMLKEPNNKMNKYLYKKIISIIEYISKETINKKFNEEEIEDNSIKDSKYIASIINFDYLNLYELFVCIKEEQKTFFDILNNNKFFIAQTSKIFGYLLEDFKNKKYNILKKNIDYITDTIFEFYKMENEDKYLKKSIIYKKKEFMNSFINKIQKSNNKEIETFKKEYELILNEDYKGNYIDLFIKIIEIFLENNEEEYFYNCISCHQTLFEEVYKDNYFHFDHLLRNLMNKNIEKFINCIPEIINLFEFRIYPKENLNKLKNYIIKNIIKSKKYELLFSPNLKIYTNIFCNYNDSIFALNYAENDNIASEYIMNKIKELFCQNDDNQLFIIFLKKSIINQYAFDKIFKIISNKKDKNFVETNKSIIFKSLNKYCKKNAYYYVDNLLKYLNDYLPSKEIQNRIFNYEFITIRNFENTNSKKEEESYDDDVDEEDDDEDNEEDKYLLLNCLNNFKKNFETIAVLLNYCPVDRNYLYIFPFLYDINIDIFLVYEYFSYMDYFSKSKNRDIINSLNKNLYNISIFLESLRKQYNYISSLPKKVQSLFNYYVSIIILQITPKDLLNEDFYDFDNDELNIVVNQRKELLKRYYSKINKRPNFNIGNSELDLFMIFALYEIKGTPLVPISKYLPDFYLKIENYCKIFKSLKIHEICLKESFDVRFIDDYLINNLKNQKVKILERIEKYPNLIFIIQKEYGDIFDISESNNYIYYQQLIYNLIKNTNLYSFSDDEKRANDYYLDLNEFRTGFYDIRHNDDDLLNVKINFVQETIFSLKDFTRCSSIIIKKISENFDSDNLEEKKIGKRKRKKKEKEEDKEKEIEQKKGKTFYNYYQYLSLIKNICSYFISQSRDPFENQDKNIINNNSSFTSYDLFILKEFLFKNDIDKIAALKNSVDINQIKYFILEQIKKFELDKIQYFDFAINWLDDYLKLNSVTKMFDDLWQISLENYFSYLYICCEIIMNWLTKIEDIIKFSRYFRDELSYFEIRFKKNSNEEKAKEELGETIYIFFSKIMKNNDYYFWDSEIAISYYLDENMKDYVETSSEQELTKFTIIKCKALKSFKTYLTYEDYDDTKDNQLYLINKAINDKNINDLYELLFFNKNTIDENNTSFLNIFKPLFEQIFEENKNYIFSYLKKTAAIANEPNLCNCLSLIKYKFYTFFSKHMLPCLFFNYRLSIFCEDINGYFGKSKYKIYINFNEIINSINKTKYHKNKKLNELFKVRAINYVINGDSIIRLHIEELYKYIKIKKKGVITETFIVKVVDGKEVKNEFNKLKMTLDSNNSINDFRYYSRLKPIKANNNNIINNNKTKKKIKLKLKLKIGEENSRNSKINENIYFSSYKTNKLKRKNVPSLGYEGHVPTMTTISGKTKGMILNDVFRNEYLKVDKKIKNPLNNIGLNEHPKKKFPGRKHFDYIEKFVNIFDLLFSIKSISKNEIVVCQNDISSVLEEYYEPNIFMSLLNYGFHDKKEKEVQLNMEIIEKYINENI